MTGTRRTRRRSTGERPGRAAFGRDRRVRKRSEFGHVQASAKRVTTAHYVFLVAARPAGAPRAHGPSRLGLIVTKKLGGAVVRNRIKRVCRECFRLLPQPLPDGIDLVVVARTGAESLGLREVQAEWATVSGLLRKRASEALARAGGMPHLSGRK